MGFERVGEDERLGPLRPATPGRPGAVAAGRILDVREDADGRRGAWGVGSVHHLAWTVTTTSTRSRSATRSRAPAGARPR
jgi:hypothetical protein